MQVVAILSPRRHRDARARPSDAAITTPSIMHAFDIPHEHFTAAAPIADHRLAFTRLSIYHYINNRSSGNSPRTWRCDGDDDVVQLQVLPCVSVRPPRRDLLPPWGWSRTPVCPGNAKRDGPTEMCKSPAPTIDDRKKVKGKKITGLKENFQSKRRPRMLRTGPLKDEAAVLLSACAVNARNDLDGQGGERRFDPRSPPTIMIVQPTV